MVWNRCGMIVLKHCRTFIGVGAVGVEHKVPSPGLAAVATAARPGPFALAVGSIGLVSDAR
jgi:hypothetical protein